ncbi:hypothetical protein WJX72_007497 [[Myrmecia] bisecta]|uniref:Uncharacterized protein n=1 Tax=[Myrmecia] bisecta TaxID=41462 RepID=A0AAW1QFK8_9CHLO
MHHQQTLDTVRVRVRAGLMHSLYGQVDVHMITSIDAAQLLSEEQTSCALPRWRLQPSCHIRCLYCKQVVAHSQESTDDADTVTGMFALGCKQCPRCSAWCSRKGGCKWIRCLACKQPFCFNCSNLLGKEHKCSCDARKTLAASAPAFSHRVAHSESSRAAPSGPAQASRKRPRGPSTASPTPTAGPAEGPPPLVFTKSAVARIKAALKQHPAPGVTAAMLEDVLRNICADVIASEAGLAAADLASAAALQLGLDSLSHLVSAVLQLTVELGFLECGVSTIQGTSPSTQLGDIVYFGKSRGPYGMELMKGRGRGSWRAKLPQGQTRA